MGSGDLHVRYGAHNRIAVWPHETTGIQTTISQHSNSPQLASGLQLYEFSRDVWLKNGHGGPSGFGSLSRHHLRRSAQDRYLGSVSAK